MAEVLSQHPEEVLLSVIISEFHLLQVKRELRLGDAVELDQTLLGERPEALQAVRINLATRVSLLVIHPHVPIAAEHQGIVTAELVRIDDGAAPDRLDRQIQQRGGRDILNYIDLYHPVSLENTEDRHLMKGAPAALPFTLPTKVRFIYFDLAPQQLLALRGAGQNRSTDQGDGFQGGWITDPNLLRDFPGRDFELEELNNPEPCFSRYFKAVDPAPGEVVEGITA